MPSAATQSLTVRLPRDLYGRAAQLARRRNVSLNHLVQEGLDQALRVAEEKARYDAYTLLGSDSDTDVDYAAHAQAEVMLSEDQD